MACGVAGWNVGERYKLNSKNEMSVFDAKTGTVYFADFIWRLDDKGLDSEEHEAGEDK